MSRRWIPLGLIAVLAAAPVAAHAEPTEIVVRILGKDSKFVGTSMGGARVVLRDAETGEVLASGLTQGGTGDTKKLMHKDGGRRARFSDESAAKFVATLDLEEPTLIEVEAIGPQAQPQSAMRASARQWVVPGRPISGGDGWLLELPGFVVDVLDPPAHVRFSPGTKKVALKANVMLMCGCPVEPKGLWDADKYEVKALIKRDGKRVGQLPLAYAGATSQFAGAVPIDAPGTYEVTVYTYDPLSGNTGLDRTTFMVERK